MVLVVKLLKFFNDVGCTFAGGDIGNDSGNDCGKMV